MRQVLAIIVLQADLRTATLEPGDRRISQADAVDMTPTHHDIGRCSQVVDRVLGERNRIALAIQLEEAQLWRRRAA